MAWTLTTLKTAIQDYLENSETTFVAQLDNIIKQAEDRILKNIQLPNFKKTSAPTLTGSTATVTVPSDFLAPYHFAIDNSGYRFLIFKDVSFIREVYPDSTSTGVPKYYALLSDTQFILGPTPDSGYTSELRYFYRPTSIVDAGSSWLGTHAESTLLQACLYEGYKFMKGDADLLAAYEKDMTQSMGELDTLAARSRTDEYRAG